MEQLVRVSKVNDDGTAQVIRIRESACSGDCHKCSGCGAARQTVMFEAVNAIGAGPGDLVTVRAESGPVLLGAAVLYLLPVALFIAGYLLGDMLCAAGTLAGCIAFVLGIVAAAVYDRRVAQKRKTVYTITGYAHTKGDNDLD